MHWDGMKTVGPHMETHLLCFDPDSNSCFPSALVNDLFKENHTPTESGTFKVPSITEQCPNGNITSPTPGEITLEEDTSAETATKASESPRRHVESGHSNMLSRWSTHAQKIVQAEGQLTVPRRLRNNTKPDAKWIESVFSQVYSKHRCVVAARS